MWWFLLEPLPKRTESRIRSQVAGKQTSDSWSLQAYTVYRKSKNEVTTTGFKNRNETFCKEQWWRSCLHGSQNEGRKHLKLQQRHLKYSQGRYWHQDSHVAENQNTSWWVYLSTNPSPWGSSAGHQNSCQRQYAKRWLRSHKSTNLPVKCYPS